MHYVTVISSSEDVGCGGNRSIVVWWWWFVIIFVPACRIRLEGIQVELDAPLQFKVLSKLDCLLCIHTSSLFLSLPLPPPSTTLLLRVATHYFGLKN